jgi:hypothetical protein
VRRLLPQVRELTAIGASMTEEQIGMLSEIVAAALQRNYPDVSPERVEDLIDLGNANAVLTAVLTGSGLRPSQAGEAAAVASNGAPSTASSPPLADTATLQ